MSLRSIKNQQGTALIVSLIILVLVSILGLSAIRASSFSLRVATGIQVDAMAFEAAESGIFNTYDTLAGMGNDTLFNNVFSGYLLCITASGAPSQSRCSSTDFFDERELIKLQTFSYFDGYEPLDGYQISSGPATIVDYRINIMGSSDVPSFNIGNNHEQETLKRGLKANDTLD